jgi:hypothetical protein
MAAFLLNNKQPYGAAYHVVPNVINAGQFAADIEESLKRFDAITTVPIIIFVVYDNQHYYVMVVDTGEGAAEVVVQCGHKGCV